jgi:preprotein translocase subunit SecB
MEIDDKNLAKLKRDYLNLVLKISKLRSKGKEPPFELITQAQGIGRLAHISEHQIDKLLFG